MGSGSEPVQELGTKYPVACVLELSLDSSTGNQKLL